MTPLPSSVPPLTAILSSKLPPLSSTLTLPKAIDNPALHQGRIRTTPHVEGQYASYVFIPLRIPRSSPLGKFIQEIYLKAKEIVPILHAVGTNDVSNEHEEEPELRISLTRPIYLRAQQREEFRVAMRAIAKRHDRWGLLNSVAQQQQSSD